MLITIHKQKRIKQNFNLPNKMILYRRKGSYETIKLYGVYKFIKTDGNIV
jgi:hypothetical protein